MSPHVNRPSVEFTDPPSLIKSPLYCRATSITAAGRFIFTAGIVGSKDGKIVPELAPQVAQAFKNLEATLTAAGARPADVVKLTFYVVNWKWTETEQLIKSWMDLASHRPATTLVPLQRLYEEGVFFEVEAVAAIGGTQKLIDQSTFSSSIADSAPSKMVDVVVIGAGFSGVQAANDVSKAGWSVALIEATHRIGGRSKTIKLASGPGIAELGATWINKTTQPKIYATAQRLGLTCIEQYNPQDGVSIFQTSDGKVHRAKQNEKANTSSSLSAEDIKSVTALLDAIDWQTDFNKNLDINNTSVYPAANDVSCEEWVKRNKFGAYAEKAIGGICRAMVGREPSEVGIHYMMDYIKSGGGFKSLTTDDEGGSQSLFIKEGTSAIAHGLAGELKPGSIFVNSPVDTINQHGSNVLVTTTNGTKIECKKVILAIPTNTYTKIHFTPPLPAPKRMLAMKTIPGVYAKALLTYASPWWRDLGLLGKFRSHIGPICFSWEVSFFETRAFTLAIFIAGERAKNWYRLSELARQNAIIEHLAELVGPENAHLARGILEFNVGNWSEEEWFGGAPTSAIPPGYLSKYGEDLRKPFMNVHFAGGETAREWKGYLEGALRAGTRAADEVINELGSKPKI
ncbi:hypothetical protein AJ78_00909 [Emergomyces pasteurianus Ep9510]|uniref:Amine oxidase n=1 Tax=Emergomyces pasteurianus Ep9510 TaxID=1447872 RepID=A0A1J9QG08_9EURO|nr:hypothetical protein AJ78_00909 [Emergomyces pasteurianus Ep9510]